MVPSLGEKQNWQAELWKALYDFTGQLGLSTYHRANLYEDFIQTLKEAGSVKGLPKRLFVFGIVYGLGLPACVPSISLG